SQVRPAAAGGCEQSPLAGSQAPTSWHCESAVHTTGAAPTHAPAPSHASSCVQRSPSSQALPAGFGGSEQTPVAVAHWPTSWHWLFATHWTGSAPRQLPAPSQRSVRVHLFPSLHAAPAGFVGVE